MMRLRQTLGHLGRVADELVVGKSASGQHFAERHALHVLHRYVRSALVLTDFVDRDDIRMVQSRGGACFLLESPKPMGVRGHLLGQDFDSDFATEFEVFGLVHFAHTAAPQVGEDFVVAEASAGLEGHG